MKTMKPIPPILAALAAGAMFAGYGLNVQAQQDAALATPEMEGIWAAIAYSPEEAEYGFFWGADTLDQARETALDHCETPGEASCEIVAEFRNYRHFEEDDETGFPYENCGALAFAGPGEAWAASTATSRESAVDEALLACEADGADCRILEWVCT
jgi:hypothetical protein